MTDAPEEKQITLTEWEREKLWWFAASNAATYTGHYVRGQHGGPKLFPNEIVEMERWKALSDKLAKTPD